MVLNLLGLGVSLNGDRRGLRSSLDPSIVLAQSSPGSLMHYAGSHSGEYRRALHKMIDG